MAFGGPLDDSTSIGSPDVATWPQVRYKKAKCAVFRSHAFDFIVSLKKKRRNLVGFGFPIFVKECLFHSGLSAFSVSKLCHAHVVAT